MFDSGSAAVCSLSTCSPLVSSRFDRFKQSVILNTPSGERQGSDITLFFDRLDDFFSQLEKGTGGGRWFGKDTEQSKQDKRDRVDSNIEEVSDKINSYFKHYSN